MVSPGLTYTPLRVPQRGAGTQGTPPAEGTAGPVPYLPEVDHILEHKTDSG